MKRAVLALGGLAGVCILGCLVYALAHLRAFELVPLTTLFGARGIAFTLLIAAGTVVASLAMLRRGFSRHPVPRLSTPVRIFLVLWAIGVLWLGEWVFMERPLTVRIAETLRGENAAHDAMALALRRAQADGSIAALTRSMPNADVQRLSVMLARIAVNRPSVFARYSIGEVISKYAARYEVSPVLLLDWTYIDSFYGEAPAGPMPFFREITGEMFRDLVQAHLPPWFIESPLRVALIEGPYLQFAGESLGLKLRYALQKATYDISVSPYQNSVYSDLFLVLREYRSEFPELFASPATDPLATAFLALEGSVLPKPYDEPYRAPKRDARYYDTSRDALMNFGRAALYRLSDDFDFATKVQALVAHYYTEQYRARIGSETWKALSERQQTALLAMLRDVYVPDIGRVSGNLYMLPEFNLTPINFLCEQISQNRTDLLRQDKVWIPKDEDAIWGATGLMLKVLGEVWDVTSGSGLPGMKPPDTIGDAVRVITRHDIA